MKARLTFVFSVALGLAACDNGDHGLSPEGDGATDGEARGDALALRHDAGPEKDANPAESGAHDDGSTSIDGGETEDASEEGDAEETGDAEEEGDGPEVLPPRPIAPLSTSRVTSRKPELRWELSSGVTSVTLDLCTDRACTQPLGDPIHVSGASYTPAANLPVGVVFWRLHAGSAAGVVSPTWEFTVGAKSAPVDTSWGTTLDVNGDGYADVAVAADVSGANTDGSVYLYLGSALGLSSTPVATLPAPAGDGSAFGFSVASAGDVNGDGYADLVVGAQGVSTNTGEAYVYLGGPSGIPSTKKPITIVSPDLPKALFGSNVASAGDVNGDGYADVLVGASEGGSSNAGTAYLYLGRAGGLENTPTKTFAVGNRVASAGDLNGDGFGDIVVGGSGTGFVYVYTGTKSGVVLAPTLSNASGGDSFGTSVANAGDVNGDGYADLLVGAAEAGSIFTGAAYVYLGAESGYDGSKPIALNDPGNAMYDQYGGTIASAGDWNGDGYADFAVSGQALTSTEGGIVYVYAGGANFGSASPTPIGMVSDYVNANDFGFGGSISAADVDDSGVSALLVGSWTVGLVYLYPGSSILSSVTLTAPVDGNFGWSIFSGD